MVSLLKLYAKKKSMTLFFLNKMDYNILKFYVKVFFILALKVNFYELILTVSTKLNHLNQPKFVSLFEDVWL